MSVRTLVLSALVIAVTLAVVGDAQAQLRPGDGGNFHDDAIGAAIMLSSLTYGNRTDRNCPAYFDYNTTHYRGYNRAPIGDYPYGLGYDYYDSGYCRSSNSSPTRYCSQVQAKNTAPCREPLWLRQRRN
jgi:hypothetical protein